MGDNNLESVSSNTSEAASKGPTISFSDAEDDWLLTQLHSPKIQAIISQNPQCVLEYDSAGNPARVARKRVRGQQDGGFKAAAREINALYLQTFNAPLLGETRNEFEARRDRRISQGYTRHKQMVEETDEHFKQQCNPDISLKVCHVNLPADRNTDGHGLRSSVSTVGCSTTVTTGSGKRNP
jgi:hypothetical protein